MSAPFPETFEPEMLALLGAVYDDAWRTVAADYVHADADTLAAARAELAAIMLRLAEQQLASHELMDQAIRQFGQVMGTSVTQHAPVSEPPPTKTTRSGINVPVN